MRSDWRSRDDFAPSRSGELDPLERAALEKNWTEQALMEHASVAAFARFTLQLLSLGAPSELVTAAARAMQDEIRHAEGCFTLARRYSGRDVGPGPLSIAGALEHADVWSIVEGTILEGCIGETVAAIEAAEALEHCQDPEVRRLLERISVEEAQHAALAWKFVAWALREHSSLAERARALFAKELGAAISGSAPPDGFELRLLRHGVLDAELRRSLKRRALAEVIAPCAEELLRACTRGAAPAADRREAAGFMRSV